MQMAEKTIHLMSVEYPRQHADNLGRDEQMVEGHMAESIIKMSDKTRIGHAVTP